MGTFLLGLLVGIAIGAGGLYWLLSRKFPFL